VKISRGPIVFNVTDFLTINPPPEPAPDPLDLLLTTVFDCAVRQNMPSCTVSWKCRPGEMLCVRECAPCPVCGGRLVHYTGDHEERGAPLA
jgi:hypothetical protein